MNIDKERKISIVPLSFKSSKLEISSFLNQIDKFINSCELIIILEENDFGSLNLWEKELKKRSISKYILETLIDVKSKGACLNLAIEKSSGIYIMRCDMDDKILENRYSDTIKIIEKYKPDFIYSDMYDLHNNKKIKYPQPIFSELFSTFMNPFPAPTVCFKKEFFLKHKINYPKVNMCEDLYLTFSFIDNNAYLFKLDNPVVKYNNNNKLNRNFLNWIYNFKIRINRNRYDFIGIISIISGFIFLIIGFFGLIFFKLKKLF